MRPYKRHLDDQSLSQSGDDPDTPDGRSRPGPAAHRITAFECHLSFRFKAVWPQVPQPRGPHLDERGLAGRARRVTVRIGTAVVGMGLGGFKDPVFLDPANVWWLMARAGQAPGPVALWRSSDGGPHVDAARGPRDSE